MKVWLVNRGRRVDSYFKAVGVNKYKNLIGIQLLHYKTDKEFVKVGSNSLDTLMLDQWQVVPEAEVKALQLNQKAAAK